ncbi:MAG: hypothetical protein M1167_01230 [Chloroflexi bacterium]|nr:hypothetical protein [Chloroflexota bacterium]
MMFVANTNSHTVSVVSASTFEVLATIDLPDYQTISALSDIEYNPRKGEILVLDYFDGTLTVISDSTLQIVRTVALGNDPYPSRLGLDDENGAIFVVYVQKSRDSKPANFISVLDDQTFEVITTIPLSSNGGVRGLDSEKGVLYVATADAVITFLSQKNYSVVATIPLGMGAMKQLAYDSGKDVLFVTNPTNNSVSIISTSTYTVIETFPLATPSRIIYLPDRGELYVGTGFRSFNPFRCIGTSGTRRID